VRDVDQYRRAVPDQRKSEAPPPAWQMWRDRQHIGLQRGRHAGETKDGGLPGIAGGRNMNAFGRTAFLDIKIQLRATPPEIIGGRCQPEPGGNDAMCAER